MDRQLKGARKKGTAAAVLMAAGLALLFSSKVFPGFAQWYSLHIYPIWVQSVGRISGIFPISLSEIFLYFFIGWILVTCAVATGRAVRGREGREAFVGWILNLFLAAGVLFFLYVLNCGINYHRESFSESSGISVRQYSAQELKEVCLWLTDEVNNLAEEVVRDGDGVMEIGRARGEESGDAGAEAVRAMGRLGSTYDGLAGYYPRPKGLIFPWILSVQNLTGIYSPFLVEANYNTAMTDYNIPFTMCHELSHLRGFMQEEEANFIAFLACRASEDAQFLYSGNLEGWVYCMNVLYEADYEAWEEVRAGLSPEVEADLRANREFWAKYDGTVAEVANQVNDAYLKANDQEDGVKSYDRMVDLIVSYYGENLFER